MNSKKSTLINDQNSIKLKSNYDSDFTFLLIKLCTLLCAVSVPFIKPCKPNDQKCILSSSKTALPYITAGIPSLGLPPVESVLIDSVRTDGNDLKLGFRNIKITGITKCQITEARYGILCFVMLLSRILEFSKFHWGSRCLVLCEISGFTQLWNHYSVFRTLFIFTAKQDYLLEINSKKLNLYYIWWNNSNYI